MVTPLEPDGRGALPCPAPETARELDAWRDALRQRVRRFAAARAAATGGAPATDRPGRSAGDGLGPSRPEELPSDVLAMRAAARTRAHDVALEGIARGRSVRDAALDAHAAEERAWQRFARRRRLVWIIPGAIVVGAELVILVSILLEWSALPSTSG